MYYYVYHHAYFKLRLERVGSAPQGYKKGPVGLGENTQKEKRDVLSSTSSFSYCNCYYYSYGYSYPCFKTA